MTFHDPRSGGSREWGKGGKGVCAPDSLCPLEDFSGKIKGMGISRTRRELAHKERKKLR
jgi:hypothetical protein